MVNRSFYTQASPVDTHSIDPQPPVGLASTSSQSAIAVSHCNFGGCLVTVVLNLPDLIVLPQQEPPYVIGAPAFDLCFEKERLPEHTKVKLALKRCFSSLVQIDRAKVRVDPSLTRVVALVECGGVQTPVGLAQRRAHGLKAAHGRSASFRNEIPGLRLTSLISRLNFRQRVGRSVDP